MDTVKNIWVTSDSHFQHSKIIEYGSRPFSSVEEMDEALVERWNSVVKPGDKVYHLGDVYFGSAETFKSIISRLNGQKRLILGNHDNGKDQVLQKYFKKISVWRMLPEFGLLLTHVPVHRSTLYKTSRRGQPDMELKNVHGHIHQNESPEGPYKCVCVEQCNYTPVHIEELRIR